MIYKNSYENNSSLRIASKETCIWAKMLCFVYIVEKESRWKQAIVTFSHQTEIFEMMIHKMNVKILNQRIVLRTQICLKLLIKEWQILLFKFQVFFLWIFRNFNSHTKKLHLESVPSKKHFIPFCLLLNEHKQRSRTGCNHVLTMIYFQHFLLSWSKQGWENEYSLFCRF